MEFLIKIIMSIGLLILVSVGKANLYLSAQPDITFFKIAYRRYTNYSSEPTPQYFKTTPDFGKRCTVNIGKNADLLGSCHVAIELPSIQIENYIEDLSVERKFAWVKKIGYALINYVEIEIGGIIIERHYGDWLNIWNELKTSLGLKKSLDKVIGNVPELTSYSSVKKSHILYIPLAFWFCLDTGLALPIIALAHSDIKIHIEFNDIDSCYKISPSHYINVSNNFCLLNKGEIFYQTYQNNKILGEFIYFDQINKNVYYNPVKGKFVVPSISDTTLKLIGNDTNFELNIVPNSTVVKNVDFFKFNKPSLLSAYILTNYIYLDNFERYNFLNNSHEYLVPIVQNLPDQIMYSINSSYKLPLINPVKMIIWRGILSANILNNNQFDYTTSIYTDEPEDLVQKNLIVINSVNRIDINSIEYYTLIQKYQHKLLSTSKGIYYYSFCLNPQDLQPSGTFNFSKSEDAYLQLKLNKIINYQNTLTLRGYGIQYNILRIGNGLGGLGFNI